MANNQVHQILEEIKARLNAGTPVSQNILFYQDVEIQEGIDDFIVIGLPRLAMARSVMASMTLDDFGYECRTMVPIDVVAKIPYGQTIHDATNTMSSEVFKRLSLNTDGTILEQSSFASMQYDLEGHAENFGRISYMLEVVTYLSANFE